MTDPKNSRASKTTIFKSDPSVPILSARRTLRFASATRAFLGHLVGTQKATLTIRNYKTDLNTFQEFLKTGLGSKPVELGQLTLRDLEEFPKWLKARGYLTNTRRRKLLTARRLLHFLKQRKKIQLDASEKIPAPHKIERIPVVIATAEVRDKVRALPVQTEIDARNQVLLWTLLESGCLVSEIATLRFDQVNEAESKFVLGGKAAREVPISAELVQAIGRLRDRKDRLQSPWIFHGFNRFGALRSPMTSRGVELVLNSLGPRLGYKGLLAKHLRASVVLFWAGSGVSKSEIQRRLGLKTDYAFRSFDPLLRKLPREQAD